MADIARIKVEDGLTTSWPIAEKVARGWQSGTMFYPDEKVVGVVTTYARISPLDPIDERVAAIKADAWDECLDAIEQNELNTGQAREGNPYRAHAVEGGN